MNAYCDGSQVGSILGWGIVIEDHGDVIEMRGARRVKQPASHCHEIVAFIETALFLHSHVVAPEDVSFVTDDQIIVYGRHDQKALGYANYGFTAEFERQLKIMVTQDLYKPEAIAFIRPYLERSRFTKVAGHDKDAICVYNRRCDYLARGAARDMEDKTTKHVKPFEDWLRCIMVPFAAPKVVKAPKATPETTEEAPSLLVC